MDPLPIQSKPIKLACVPPFFIAMQMMVPMQTINSFEIYGKIWFKKMFVCVIKTLCASIKLKLYAHTHTHSHSQNSSESIELVSIFIGSHKRWMGIYGKVCLRKEMFKS